MDNPQEGMLNVGSVKCWGESLWEKRRWDNYRLILEKEEQQDYACKVTLWRSGLECGVCVCATSWLQRRKWWQ